MNKLPIEMALRVASEHGTKDSQIDDGNLYAALRQCLDRIDVLESRAEDENREVACCVAFCRDDQGQILKGYSDTIDTNMTPGTKLYLHPSMDADDARRYRWLKGENNYDGWLPSYYNGRGYGRHEFTILSEIKDLDAAIDSAMQGEAQ
jgi:hypothetical protein